MQKRFISLLLVIIASISVFPGMPAMAATASEQYMFVNDNIMRAGATRGALDVNFDLGFTSIDVYLSTASSAHQIKGDLRIDGINGKVIGSFDYPGSIVPSSWSSPVNFRVQMTEIVTGVHDVYLMNKSGEYYPSHIMCNYLDGSKTIYKAYADEYTFNDIYDNEDAARIEFLTQLGFFEKEESFSANIPVSRADILNTLARFYDEREYPEVPIDVFKDVENEKTREAAYFLYTKNILKLEDTAYLKPSEYIKISELVQYGANMFPHDESMLRKINDAVSSDDGYVRRTQLVDMLYTVVTAKYEIMRGNPLGKMYYEEYDKGILGETKKWYLAEGLVTANSYTGLYSGEDKTKDYTVRIGDYVYDIGDTNADTYIGIFCEFIWHEDNDNLVLKGIVPKYPSNINTYSNEYEYKSFTGDGITYMNEADKKCEIEFSSHTKIIYNSRALDVEIESVIPDASKFRGNIIAIDNDRNNIIDVCIINAAKSMVIKSISNDFIIDELSGKKIEFSKDSNVEFIRNGIKTGAEDYSVGESIDIYISQDGMFCQIVQGSEFMGKAIRTSQDEITFDSEKIYKLSPYAVYLPKVGDAGIFKLNTFGEIIHYKKSDSSLLTVGWMIKTFENVEDESVGITIKTTDNKKINYAFAEKVRADGVFITEQQELINGKMPFVGVANLEQQQPILYRLNENNEVQVIDTIEEGNSDIHYDQLCKSLEPMNDGQYMIRNSGIVYTYGSRTKGASYDDGGLAYVDSGVVRYSKSSLNESLSKFDKNVSLTATTQNFAGYSFKKGSPKIDLLLVSAGAEGNTWLNPLVYTGKKRVKLNEDNELVSELEFESEDKVVKYSVNNVLYENDATYRAKVDSLQKGDLICGKYDSASNELMLLDLIHFMGNEYDGNGDTRPVGASDTYSSLLNCSKDSYAYEWEKRVLLGNVAEVDSEYIKVQRAVETQYTELMLSRKVTVINLDEKGEVIEKSSSIASICEGQKIICFFAKGQINTIYIYKNMND